MVVDILVPVGNKGGVEKIVYLLCEYIKGTHDWDIRVIQLVGTSHDWLPEGTDHTIFNSDMGRYETNVFVEQYTEYLIRRGLPDIILASVWPLCCVIARLSVQILKPAKSIPIVSWSHAPINVYEKANFGKFSHLMMADVQLAISEYIYSEIVSHLSGANVLPIKNPVDISSDKLFNVSSNNTDSSTHNLLFVGRLNEEKGLETAIEALSNLPNWTMSVIGCGENGYEDELHKLIESYNIADRITFYGWQSDPWKYAKDNDWLIMPSVFEGFALTAIEALSRGIPVISTPVSGIIEVVKPGVTGYLFDLFNSNQLTEILSAISQKKLPSIDPYKCRDIVKRYNSADSFRDFCAKIEEIYLRGKCNITDKFTKTYLYEDDLITIIIPINDDNATLVGKCLNAITNQTFPMASTQIIIVNAIDSENVNSVLYDYESKFTDNILIINTDITSMDNQFDLVDVYIEGNLLMYIQDYMCPVSTLVDQLYRKIKLYDCDVAISDNHNIVSNITTANVQEVIIDNRAKIAPTAYNLQDILNLESEYVMYKKSFFDKCKTQYDGPSKFPDIESIINLASKASFSFIKEN